jgi:hypothetical protein
MNERILELAKQSGLIQYDSDGKIEEVKEFAILLIQECASISENYAARSMPLSSALEIIRKLGVKP